MIRELDFRGSILGGEQSQKRPWILGSANCRLG